MKLIPTPIAAISLGLAFSMGAAGCASADHHSSASSSKSEEVVESETQSIVDVLKRYETYANAGDYESLGGLYTADGVLFPDRFDVFLGAEDITGFYQFAFSALTLDIDFNIDPANITVAGDVAYATTDSAGTRYIKEADLTVPEVNRELWVFEKVDGEWKIARYCFNKSE
ncbi:MAG: nuclear transport factor 2 family protein [Pseudomonadota bacterium]